MKVDKGYVEAPVDDIPDLKEAILKLKREKNAVVLAHYYQKGEIQDIADFIGDSLALAQIARKLDNDIIVMCGVHFMGETVKILCPEKKVLVPDLNAGCSLADSCRAEDLEKFVAEHPGHTVISYVNTTAAVKALTDIVVTSGNARKIIDALPADAFALTNAADKPGAVMLQNTAARRATYSLQKMADFRGRVIEERLDGMALSLNDKEINVMFTGRFNAYNLTAVYGACCLLGWNPEEVLVNMSRLVPVAGRFQTFHSADGVTAIVDYAHTPDAVVNVLNAIRDVLGSKGSILTVVGAGGNR
ncbi:MAG: quinolinate synthase NadA, partial [Duncaniella sp.]|nr:quinolinate synthase NadA [Duncaniella sp.]